MPAYRGEQSVQVGNGYSAYPIEHSYETLSASNTARAAYPPVRTPRYHPLEQKTRRQPKRTPRKETVFLHEQPKEDT